MSSTQVVMISCSRPSKWHENDESPLDRFKLKTLKIPTHWQRWDNRSWESTLRVTYLRWVPVLSKGQRLRKCISNSGVERLRNYSTKLVAWTVQVLRSEAIEPNDLTVSSTLQSPFQFSQESWAERILISNSILSSKLRWQVKTNHRVMIKTWLMPVHQYS